MAQNREEQERALAQMPDIYRALTDSPYSAEGTPVLQHERPGGGSESLRWASSSDIAAAIEADARKRRRARERAYFNNPYGPADLLDE